MADRTGNATSTTIPQAIGRSTREDEKNQLLITNLWLKLLMGRLMQVQSRIASSCELCNDLNSNIVDSTDDRFRLIDGLHAHRTRAKPFGALDNSNDADGEGRDRYAY
ncbi:hypothetical protein DBV15_11213 [Temnothorax longispinosus]|uniref:Uncharacterized protein n=1 Tax=Temnothorax longispinosus TaxID=300112 RepID=A0A4S2JLC7_9HYME|nr:hypothetical protein DBV15_11213 [Temnothorax longispinosus]